MGEVSGYSKCRLEGGREQFDECMTGLNTCENQIFGTEPIHPLAFEGLDPLELRQVWAKIITALAGKRLCFIGDSLAYNHAHALTLYLWKEFGFYTTNGVSPNGFTITRPLQFNPAANFEAFSDVLSKCDASLVNFGTHQALDLKHYKKVLPDFLSTAAQRKLRFIWLDTPYYHFPNPHGNYAQFRDMMNSSERYQCGRLSVPIAQEDSVRTVADICLAHFPQFGHVHTHDVYYDRWDAHRGYLTHYIDANDKVCLLTHMLACTYQLFQILITCDRCRAYIAGLRALVYATLPLRTNPAEDRSSHYFVL